MKINYDYDYLTNNNGAYWGKVSTFPNPSDLVEAINRDCGWPETDDEKSSLIDLAEQVYMRYNLAGTKKQSEFDGVFSECGKGRGATLYWKIGE